MELQVDAYFHVRHRVGHSEILTRKFDYVTYEYADECSHFNRAYIVAE